MSNFYPVMLVEEKEHMIKLISNMLPWKSYGFEIVSVANGEDRALAYYGEYKHKIVFTAIDLKRGNGISLIKQLRYLDQSLIIVVISNHDDYDNIRNAFKAGANDYLIKARLRYGDIASILEQAKVNLAQDNNEEQAENWCQKLESYLGLIRDKQKIDDALVYDIIRKQTEFILLNEPYRIIYFRMDNIRNFNRTTRQYDKPSWMSTEEFITMFQNRLLLRDQIQYKLKVIIEDYFKDVPKAFVIFSKKHSGLIILPDHDIEWLKEKTFNLLQLIFGTILCEFSATISTTYQGIDGFVDHYKDITNYHDHKFYDGDMCLELMDDDKKYEHLHDIDDHFLALIDNQLYDEIIPLKNKIITEMVAYNIYPQEVKDYFCTLITKIEKMILRKDISMNYPFDIFRQGIIESESIIALSNELEKIMHTLISYFKENFKSKNNKKIDQIKAYIDHHLHEKMTLKDIAGEIGLSEIHTSRIFKSETGQGLMEYINDVKMQKAKDLLKNNELRIKEVSAMVGISDQLYFNKVFKKYYKLSPREYRKKLT